MGYIAHEGDRQPRLRCTEVRSVFKPAIGWTVLSREDVRQVERSLANNEHDTRDEIGFLILHQAFADRFFPGTSVQHTRIRYSIFVPWIYQDAAQRRGGDVENRVRRQLIELAIRLKQHGREPVGVIGGDKLGTLTSQPPDHVYWTALRNWGLLLPDVESRANALSRLSRGSQAQATDDDGGFLSDESLDVFGSLPKRPNNWHKSESGLRFTLEANEKKFLRDTLTRTKRPNDAKPSLLANCVAAGAILDVRNWRYQDVLMEYADADDKLALSVARDAAALAAVGRSIYGALVEELLTGDGRTRQDAFRRRLESAFGLYGEDALRCDLKAAGTLLPEMPDYLQEVLTETKAFIGAGKPSDFFALRECYKRAEVSRKTIRRARLVDTVRGAERRAEWKPDRHNTDPLHYRWHVVRSMLTDVASRA